MDVFDEVMESLLSRPEPEWEAAVDELCRSRPDLASEVRRRFGVLRESGLLPMAATHLDNERLRQAITCEALASMLEISTVTGQPAAKYQRALRAAEFELARDPGFVLGSATAALATLRLERPAETLRHCDTGLEERVGREPGARNILLAARTIALQVLGRTDEARAALGVLQQALAGVPDPDPNELRLLHEAERGLAK
jgi:hypothetical protein